MSLRPLRLRLTRPVFLWPALALILELLLHEDSSRWLRLLPVVPMLLFVAALCRAIWRMDELQQRISVMSMSVAFVLTLVLTLLFAGLETAGLYSPHWNDLGTYMLILWACAYALSAWRYR